MTGDVGREDRRWQRFKVELPVDVSVLRKGEEIRFKGAANNISEGGIRLFIAGELHAGETIEFQLSLPYSSKVSLRGVIRNRERYEYGVEYIQPSAKARDAIVRNCRAMSLLNKSEDT